MRRMTLWWVGLLAVLTLVAGTGPTPATAQDADRQGADQPAPADHVAQPTAIGTGGAVATVDHLASVTGRNVLRSGGNAVDAAVAAAAVLGVVEPFSCGIGGGGFMLVYLADADRVISIDSRETAPQAYFPEVFLDPDTGEPIPFDERVTSGLGVGVPGTVQGWHEALERYGTRSLAQLLGPAIHIAQQGFVVDATFAAQVESNAERFADFTSTRELFLPGGEPPAVGSVLRNPDLARTYRTLAEGGATAFYQGDVAEAIVNTVTDPPVIDDAERTVRPGLMTTADLRDYEARIRQPTEVTYRGLDVYGMGPPSSGGSTVGEALQILEGFNLSGRRPLALHRYLEASRLSFADRNAYLGDPEYTTVPLEGLLSDGFAAERREEIGPRANASPVGAGDPFPYQDDPSFPLRPDAPQPGTASVARSASTTHLTVADDDGNVVAYTFTIEQTGGSGIVVPDHGFLLNNELTDFNPLPPHPNAPEAGKRPRSSIAPTIVLRDGEPVLALGTPGGARIITTVLQLLVNVVDFDLTLPEAIAAPRVANLDTAASVAEPAFLASPAADALERRGHEFSETPELGAATGIAFLSDGVLQAAAEPQRRGGGSALVVRPVRGHD